jgi:hypothetical protein
MGIVPALPPFAERDLSGALYYWAPRQLLLPCYILRRDIELSEDKEDLATKQEKYRQLRAEVERETWRLFCRDQFTTITGIPQLNTGRPFRQEIPHVVAVRLRPDFLTNSAGNDDEKFLDVKIRALAPLDIAMRFDADLWEPGRSAFRVLSPDYRAIMHKGLNFELGELQAKAIKLLHEALVLDRPALNSKELMHQIGSPGHVSDLFKGPKRVLIQLVSVGFVCLNVFEGRSPVFTSSGHIAETRVE